MKQRHRIPKWPPKPYAGRPPDPRRQIYVPFPSTEGNQGEIINNQPQLAICNGMNVSLAVILSLLPRGSTPVCLGQSGFAPLEEVHGEDRGVSPGPGEPSSPGRGRVASLGLLFVMWPTPLLTLGTPRRAAPTRPYSYNCFVSSNSAGRDTGAQDARAELGRVADLRPGTCIYVMGPPLMASQTGQLETTATCSLPAPQAPGPRSGCGQGWLLLWDLGAEPAPCPSPSF